MKIGMFDSGVGGLTVLKEFLTVMPNNEYIYVGDCKRLPYGNKSQENITLFAHQITSFLIKEQVDLIVVACGTVSAVALTTLQSKYKVPIIGVIEPTVKQLPKELDKVLIIATEATIKSNMWEKTILKDHQLKVYSKACPLFVPIVEEGITDGIIAEEIIKLYLNKYKDIDTIILGCTHYPLLVNSLKKIIGDIKLINPGLETAQYVYNHYHNSDSKYKLTIYLSDINDHFIDIGNKILNQDISNIVHKIDFE